MNSGKRLIVHAGGSKTGSTAIQNYCELNIKTLIESGFSYQNAEGLTHTYQFTSGNGKPLFDALQAGALTETDIDNVVCGYWGACDAAICSSEYFEVLGVEGWKKLWESTQRLNASLTVIYFVRSVVPFLLSAYDQAIKHHGEFKTLEEWSSDAGIRWNHVDALRRMESESEHLDLKVLYFDHCKQTLLDSFFAAIDCPLTPTASNRQTVNRSLTAIERQALRDMNKSLGYLYSAEITSFLIGSAPEVVSEPASYSQFWLEKIVEKYHNDVLWVNNRFFQCNQVVEILPASLSAAKRVPDSIQQTKSEVSEKILQWAIEKLKKVQQETRLHIVRRLHNALENSLQVLYPGQPSDFDPLSYLVLNPDVLFEEIEPAFHYFCSGKDEGRKYKFSQTEAGFCLPKLNYSDNRYHALASALKQLNMQFHNICRGTSAIPALSLEKSTSEIAASSDVTSEKTYLSCLRIDQHVGSRTECCLTVVLGMHRSGTSAITRALKVFDIQLGDRLMQAGPDNERGFWEDIDINALNMEILSAIASGWDHTLPIEPEKFVQLEKSEYFSRAVNLLCLKTENSNQFAFKDPRLAKLLPFWKSVFSFCGFKVRYVISLRNPLCVCRSLKERDGFEHGKSYALWLGHVISSLQETHDAPRILIDYDLLMDQTSVELDRISHAFSISEIEEYRAEYSKGFLAKQLRHSTATCDDVSADPQSFPMVLEVYQELSAVARGEVSLNDEYLADKLVQWESEYNRMTSVFCLIDQLSSQKTLLSQQLQAQKAYMQQLLQERNNIDLSFLELGEKLTKQEEQLKAVLHLLSVRERHIDYLTQNSHTTAHYLENLKQTILDQEQALTNAVESINLKDRLIADISSDGLLAKQQFAEINEEKELLDQKLTVLHRVIEERNQQVIDLQVSHRRLEQTIIEQGQNLNTLSNLFEGRSEELIELQDSYEALKTSYMVCQAKLKEQDLVAKEKCKK